MKYDYENAAKMFLGGSSQFTNKKSNLLSKRIEMISNHIMIDRMDQIAS